MTDLSILVDYTRYSGTGGCPLAVGIRLTRIIDIALRDSLTVDKGRNPGVNFLHKMLRLVPIHAWRHPSLISSLRLAKSRGHIIYNDTSLNGAYTVHLNIYRNFLVTAAKFHYYLDSWGVGVSKNLKFLHSMFE